MKWIVGSYAASPCHSEWNPEIEKKYWDGLKKLEGIQGLELPFFGSLHRYDSEWLLENLHPSWDYVITNIPGTMETLKHSPTFGLASNSVSGRAQALEFAEKARQAVLQIHRRLGRNAVKAVEIHSAPTLGKSGIQSSAQSFAMSLSELRSWDWEGATLLVEHCDRFIEGQEAAKGYLSIEEEISAIKESQSERTPVGMLINWGRSVIEARRPEGVIEHLLKAQNAGLLEGLIFSGCTIEDALYGHFADSHAPFEGSEIDLEPKSLMTLQRVQQALNLIQRPKCSILGFKIQALPKDLSVTERLRKMKNWIRFLDQAAIELE